MGKTGPRGIVSSRPSFLQTALLLCNLGVAPSIPAPLGAPFSARVACLNLLISLSGELSTRRSHPVHEVSTSFRYIASCHANQRRRAA